jgi:hypothetical protein
MLLAMRFAAIAGTAAGLAAFGFVSPGFQPEGQLILIWALAPLPLDYFVARCVVHHPVSARVALTLAAFIMDRLAGGTRRPLCKLTGSAKCRCKS